MSSLTFIDNYKAVRARIEAQGRAFHERHKKPSIQIDEPAPVVIQYEPPYRTIYSSPIGPLITEPGVIDFIYGMDCRRRNNNAKLTLAAILQEVAAHFNVERRDLMAHRRHKEIGWPRQVFMWRARHETLRTLPEIGRFIGGRDHTTVLHAVRKIDALLASGKITRAEIGAPAEAGAE